MSSPDPPQFRRFLLPCSPELFGGTIVLNGAFTDRTSKDPLRFYRNNGDSNPSFDFRPNPFSVWERDGKPRPKLL